MTLKVKTKEVKVSKKPLKSYLKFRTAEDLRSSRCSAYKYII